MINSLLAVLILSFWTVTAVPKLSQAPSDASTGDRRWITEAMKKLWEERIQMEHTPIFSFTYSVRPDVEIIFKNESASKTASLKHRYALMLMMWALREGKINEGITVYEASSGNTANSLAYMCRLIGVNFTAIVPDTLEPVKQEHIEDYGGRVIKVPISERLVRARKEAEENGGFFMNQFGNADRAEDFHESGDFEMESANLFHELLMQLRKLKEQETIPNYFVHTAGTGGTISSVGRYIRKYSINTKVVLADTEFSIYYDYVLEKKFINESGASLWVEPGMSGTGFGPMGAAKHGETTSLDSAVIDRVIKIPDLASTAGMHVLKDKGYWGGPSSGINFIAALHIAATENPQHEKLIISTLLADMGRNYQTSYYNTTWINENFSRHGGLKAFYCWKEVIDRSLSEPIDPLNEGKQRCSKEKNEFN